MNLKVTAGLIILAIIAGSVAYINPFATDAVEEEKSPWFYQVEMDDIMDISISHTGDSVEFYRTDQNWWSFVDPPNILFRQSRLCNWQYDRVLHDQVAAEAIREVAQKGRFVVLGWSLVIVHLPKHRTEARA